jgi:probable F420-dependent oxidoreductase
VRIGFGIPISGAWATPDNQIQVARRAEELGYHSLWTFQRLLVPEPPDERAAAPAYRSVLDAIVPLAFVAARTSRIRLGLSVVNIPFFAPAVLANQLTTLDVLSRGRLDVGLGIGWSRQEYAAVGVAYRRRGARAEEFIAALRALWTEEVVEFHGELYEIPRSRVEPKPVQRPHPPLLLGGAAEAALRRAGRLADGWTSSSGADLSHIGDSIEIVRQAAREAGRDPAALRIVSRGPLRVRPAGDPARPPLTGSFDEIRRDLDDLREQGVTEVFLDMNYDPEIVSPATGPAEALRRAETALEKLAP